ncbi:hypothetical protein DFS34DRAFT_10549 [Phlyctochytrium arcticum]|nr:hypothetical protein DFS34DRAFT_10549 [Phlyctochytrium arcticum]
MYMERLSEYEREHLAIRKGTHPTLVKQMEEFDQKKEERLRAAAARLRFEQMSFQRQYESAVAQAQTDFICKRGDLRRQMIAEIEQKRWQMYDEKRKIDLVELGNPRPVIPDRATCLKRRKALQVELIEWRAIISNGGFPAATIPGLTKNEINEDLELIGIQTARSHSVPGGRTKKPQPQNLNGKGSSDSVMRMPAPPLQPSYSVGVTYSKIEEGSAATFDVHVDGDLLRYQGLPFRRNDKAYLFDNGSKYSIKITGITHSEILVQRTDGSRTRIPIEHLEDGRMQLQPKGHG